MEWFSELEKDQEVCIGKEIKIKVLKIRGSRVTFGIDAPRSIRVVRPCHEGEKDEDV